MLAVGAGSLAVNAVKGVLGKGDKAEEEVDKHAKKAQTTADDSISKALESLRKSGKALPPLTWPLPLCCNQISVRCSLWSKLGSIARQYCTYRLDSSDTPIVPHSMTCAASRLACTGQNTTQMSVSAS